MVTCDDSGGEVRHTFGDIEAPRPGERVFCKCRGVSVLREDSLYMTVYTHDTLRQRLDEAVSERLRYAEESEGHRIPMHVAADLSQIIIETP